METFLTRFFFIILNKIKIIVDSYKNLCYNIINKSNTNKKFLGGKEYEKKRVSYVRWIYFK